MILPTTGFSPPTPLDDWGPGLTPRVHLRLELGAGGIAEFLRLFLSVTLSDLVGADH